MIKVAICDNDISEVTKIRNLVTVYDDFDLYTYSDPLRLCKDIAAGVKFDIYLLDIVMPEMSGLELATQIRLTDEVAFIFFLTNHDKHALSAYGVRAFQYLLKPVNSKVLYSELDIARNFIFQRDRTLLPIKTRTGLVAIPFHNIAYCFVEDRCIICVHSDGQVTKSSTLRIPFGTAVMPLLEDRSFVQTHISFVANMNCVSSLHEKNFMMKDKTLIPIAQRAYPEVKERYLAHVFGGDSNSL